VLASGDDAHRGAVVLPGGVARGDGGVGIGLPANRSETRERFDGDVAPGVFASIDDDVRGPALARTVTAIG